MGIVVLFNHISKVLIVNVVLWHIDIYIMVMEYQISFKQILLFSLRWVIKLSCLSNNSLRITIIIELVAHRETKRKLLPFYFAKKILALFSYRISFSDAVGYRFPFTCFTHVVWSEEFPRSCIRKANMIDE